MAPIQRTASQANAGIGRKVHRKRVTRREPSDSWNLLNHQGMNPNADDIFMQNEAENHSPTVEEPPDVEEAVGPLREMAERVGKEVETFAQTLDEFFEDLPTATSRFDAAHELVSQFKGIAERAVDELKGRHERDLREELKKEWSEQARISAVSSAPQPAASSRSLSSLSAWKAKQVQDLRQWQQEADIWDLFRMMLELHPFESGAQDQQTDQEQTLDRLGPPHRYTSEADLWQRFIAEDRLGKERYQIKEWLERTAIHQNSDLQGIVEELEKKAGRGKGLWSSGWLETRERIKGEKRKRSWPNAADSPLPQIRRSDNQELLTTTLDPDAAQRQQRTLEKPDAYFERAIWVACWEMLRRGSSWQDVCEWCEERKEGWRAVCMGMVMDSTEPAASTAAWRRMCRLASQSDGATEYEAAVYGLLGGDLKAVRDVCRSVDDHFYAHYNSALLQQFEGYVLKTCPGKAPPQQWRRNDVDDSLQDPKRAEEAIKDLIQRLRKGSTTSNESAKPMKIIQSYLLADEVGSMIHTVGACIAETASLHGLEDMIFLRDREAPQDGVILPETEVALDPRALRIATHMSIVHRILSPEYLAGLDGDELHEDENVLVAYIQALRAAGKRDLIIIYASKLRREQYIFVLGQMLQDITDSNERTRILSLMQKADLDVVSILNEQLKWVVSHSLGGEYVRQPLRILEDTEETKLHPGQRIDVEFLPNEILPEDEAVVRCLQWFQQLQGEWKITFDALALALRRCLVTGRFSCARYIVQNFPYEAVSMRKSYPTIGRSINLMEHTTSTPYDEEEAMSWDLMRRQSRTYYEMTQLVHAVEKLYDWRLEENKYLNKSPRPTNVPNSLKKAKGLVTEALDPIIKGILQSPVDEDEGADLAHIRVTLIPEIIIAYNTVLHAAGNLITRDCLLESMELSVAIANGKESNGLEECFVEAGRMRELVKSFALTSKVMLILKAEGKVWKPRKDRRGQDLGMWEIAGSGVRAGGDE
ncbi:Nucleoporin nup84 [Vermiconidia calcicola]|uniref:Nucleoporin nup84 n=1 Tax=Vermiconidia calcicola TaxID=1690605 RepID=A0ACC3MGW6_9PEZI|nr:Nucleoporin nup84 [Vermiconidia calcicola]